MPLTWTDVDHPAAIAMLLGIIGSVSIHLSQGMMRLGIARMSPGTRFGRRLYVIGLIVNATAPLWVIAANRFAPTPVFTFVYAIGLLPLMLFARAKLAEPLPVTRAVGVLMFVLGAGAMAVAMAGGNDHAMHQLDLGTILAMALLWLIGAPLVPLVLRGTGARRSDIVLGALGGVFLAFDSILKGISQSHPDGSSFLPETQTGWLLFGASFLGSAGALGMVQWAHFRRCAPTNVIASYDLAYLAVPALCVHLLGDAPPITFGFVGAIALTLSGWWLIVRLSHGGNAQARL